MLLKDLDAAFANGTEAAAEGNSGSNVSLSGLLASLDSIDSAEGWCVSISIRRVLRFINRFCHSNSLIFFTVNHVERLDPALSRPGRMDVWVNFTHTTKSQAKRFFEHIFWPRPSASSPNGALSIDAPPENPVRPRRQASAHVMPILEDREIVELAESFADAIPEGEISVCSVSYLSPVSVPMHGLLFRLLA